MKFKITTKKTIPDVEAQKAWKSRQSRKLTLAIILVVIILMFLMILRPSVIRKKHLRSYGAEIGHLSPAENFCLAFPVLIH
jgi:heme/copper-type cytochrome/quinol oxidase subunit 2